MLTPEEQEAADLERAITLSIQEFEASSSPSPLPETSLHIKASTKAEYQHFPMFYLNRTPFDISEQKYALRIDDLIQEGLVRAMVTSYLADIEWLLTAAPALLGVPLLVLHGDKRLAEHPPPVAASLRLTASRRCAFFSPDYAPPQPGKISLWMPRLPLPYGTHHTKIMLLEYPAGLRVAVTTANLVETDWIGKTQAIWYQDFPRRAASQAETTAVTSIKRRPARPAVAAHRKRARVEIVLDDDDDDESSGDEVHSDKEAKGKTSSDGQASRDPADGATNDFAAVLSDYLTRSEIDAAFLAQFDFSAASVDLIPSVPGRHQGATMRRYGHLRARDLLSRYELPCEFRSSPLICQFSSFGSLDEKWLCDEFTSSLLHAAPTSSSSSSSSSQPRAQSQASKPQLTSKTRLKVAPVQSLLSFAGAAPKPAPIGPRRPLLVWPTVENVRQSIFGYLSGDSLCLSEKCVREWWMPLLCPWHAEHVGRQRVMPHSKLYCRAAGPHLAWTLLTSSNVSKAAWGAVQNKGTTLMIRSYEMGVLFTPTRFRSALSCHAHTRSFACTPNAPRTPLSLHFDPVHFYIMGHPGQNENALVFPLPFRVPPPGYAQESGARPWVWDRHYPKPDAHGRPWPRAM